MESQRKVNNNVAKRARNVDVIDKVEIQNPYIKQFGRENFNLQSYLDEILSKNDMSMIK